jgi:hypothetical protein
MLFEFKKLFTLLYITFSKILEMHAIWVNIVYTQILKIQILVKTTLNPTLNCCKAWQCHDLKNFKEKISRNKFTHTVT